MMWIMEYEFSKLYLVAVLTATIDVNIAAISYKVIQAGLQFYFSMNQIVVCSLSSCFV